MANTPHSGRRPYAGYEIGLLPPLAHALRAEAHPLFMGVTAPGVNYRTATLQPLRQRQIPCQKLHESRTKNFRICIGESAKEMAPERRHQSKQSKPKNPA